MDGLKGFAWEKATVTNAEKKGTPATYGGTGYRSARAALITVETNGIRLRYDGGAANATDGHVIAAGASILIEGNSSVRNMSMYRSGAADATVQITYLR